MMNKRISGPEPAWSRQMEVVGSELFLRYRKRILENGISMEIWRDYPGLSLPDVWLRVHAARQIVRDGEDFAALAAIRHGRWQWVDDPRGRARDDAPRDDRVSRTLVMTGGALFVVFCGLSLAVAVSGGSGAQGRGMFLVLLTGAAVAGVWRRVRTAKCSDTRGVRGDDREAGIT